MVQRTVFFLVALTLALVLFGIVVASSMPDGLEHVAEELGFDSKAEDGPPWSPFADYEASFLDNSWQARVLAGLLGAALLYGFGTALGAALKGRGDN